MVSAIYVHVPFCKSKCAYCDFESHAGKLCFADDYITAVLSEAKERMDEYKISSVPSVYVGGGTPSLLSKEQLQRLIYGIREIFPIEADCEFSMEMNPGTVNVEKMEAVKKAGVNRVSFGAQAYQEELLKMLGRIHTWAQAKEAVYLAKDSGINNINIDLMYALPMQTEEDVRESVKQASMLPITHISMYSLILEEGTRMHERVKNGELTEADDETAIRMHRAAMEEAEKRCLMRYEISNYAHEGMECRHNICYWTRGNYLGLGCAAHSLMNERRFSNPGFHDYMKGAKCTEESEIGLLEAMEESVMLETRMVRGLDLTGFSERYGRSYAEKIMKAAAFLERGGLLRISGGKLSLTDAGLDVQNAVVGKLIEAL
ncbi:MAG: radical SAM family heme chaperone HemW [Clostridia bacterium]|nr:radical SAM family heme chaperone HemW [Clostridia bacterium]